MSGAFLNGVSINVHSRTKKLKHLRIKAGPQRDCYVHDLVFKAKIMGRREAFTALFPNQPVPEDDFYRYLDLTFEVVDHHDEDSMNNEPENLNRMRRGANAAKGVRHKRDS